MIDLFDRVRANFEFAAAPTRVLFVEFFSSNRDERDR
jgi:hypothetical protein